MAGYPKLLANVIQELGKLPGIGVKTAERLAFHLLRSESSEAYGLADAIRKLKSEAVFCTMCQNLAEQNPCEICSDPNRNASVILVVEQPKDLIVFEKAAFYDGRYYVLMGHIAPLEGDSLKSPILRRLGERVKEEQIKEVILATNPTVEGDGTALYIAKFLENVEVKITRIAKGIASGTTIEFANKAILSDAFTGRQAMQLENRNSHEA